MYYLMGRPRRRRRIVSPEQDTYRLVSAAGPGNSLTGTKFPLLVDGAFIMKDCYCAASYLSFG